MSDPTEAAAVEALESFRALIAAHADCSWVQVGLCVYCGDHSIRLYQGDLPDHKRTIPRCADGEHDWDYETGLGFYYACRACGEREWTE